MERRTFLRSTVLGATAFALAGGWPSILRRVSAADGPYGVLGAADVNGFQLPPGFSSRVIATTGQIVPGSTYIWHTAPDGGATFPTTGGGWIYVSNSEVTTTGGAGMVRFDSTGAIVEAKPILIGTNRNCAGGPTPWGKWLSCEETADGRVFECDPTGVSPAVERLAMGRFNHEAAAVDPVRKHVYLTEDQPDGALYRFVPTSYPDLSAGSLYALRDVGGVLSWGLVPDPDGSPTPTKQQVANVKTFNGGEGLWYDTASAKVWFTTKGDNRVWTYDPVANALAIVYDDSTSPTPVLTGVDNVTVSSSGDVFVCEDGGNMEVCLLTPEGEVVVFARLTGVTGSEMTGVAFSPSGTRMYVSSQRTPGRTYEITGPFRTTPPVTTTTTTSTTTTTVPPGIVLAARAYKVKGKPHVDLTWTGATTASVAITRNGAALVTTANDGAYTDSTGLKAGRTYTYRLCNTGTGASCSTNVTVTA